MDFDTMISRMDAATCQSLRLAIELGKFPDGRRLTEAQRALCMDAVIAWEHRNLRPEERTGYIDRGSKSEGESCGSGGHDHAHDAEQPLHLRDPRH